MYTFNLVVTSDRSMLTLLKDGEVCAEEGWPESRDMGVKLFAAIKNLLTKEGLKPTDVTNFEVESEVGEMNTSARIAETVKKVYTYAVDVKTHQRLTPAVGKHKSEQI